MLTVTIVCARCTLANHVSDRFCAACGLPLGAVQPDAGAAHRRARALRSARAGRSRRGPADRRVRQTHRLRRQPRAGDGSSSFRCGLTASKRSTSARPAPTPKAGRS